MISRFIRTLVLAAALQPFGLLAGVLTVSKTQFEVAVAPGFDHADLNLPITLTSGASVADLSVVSDLSWVVPEVSPDGTVGVRFQTRGLLSSATATLTVTHGSETQSIFVSAVVKPLEVYRLLDDPFRNVTYGIQFDGENAGAVFTYDPIEGTKAKCVTVGKRPTDFVLSDDGSELLVICSAEKSIHVIDLATLVVKEIIQLPIFESWGSATDTTANIDLGAGDIIYYTDGSWGPIMRVYNRATRQVIQSIRFGGNAPSIDTGFQDFAVTKDRRKMVAMPQYGWSAGGHTPVIAHYSIAADGRLTFISQSTATTGLQREPFEAPALISENSQTVFLKTIAVSSQNINDIQKSFPSAVWSISPGGEWVATATDIYDYTTGNKLLTIPGASAYNYYSGYTGTKAQAFTSDYARFVYFNATDRTLNSLNLVDLIGPGPARNGFSPVPGAVVTAPQKLSWAARLGITNYHLYIGTSLEAVTSATQASPEFTGAVSGTQYQSSSIPSAPGTYYWRLDPVTAIGPSKGSVYSFTISPIALDRTALKVRTVKGVGSIQQSIQLSSISSGEAWTASSDREWIGFPVASGTSPASLTVTIDTTALPAGVHLGNIKLTTSVGELTIPVEITLDALKLTVLKSDPSSSKLYGISEDTAAPGSKAYLLEIDSATETILRVQEVGTSATDLSLHRLDGKIYVTNWMGGALLAVDRATFQVTRTFPFNTFGGVGYGDGDAYRISSGGPGRLVVEEMDQWVDINIFDTISGTKLGKASVREGGGSFDSSGRYYYHGENNSSGAKILRYDVTGDVFTQVASARPSGISYYGSRTVVVSEDDQRIFWANVAFDPTLVPEWTVGETVYSCTADGRYAFSENKIYDINRRLWVLGMPVSTKVSAYNSTSAKLVVQGPAGLLFTQLGLPLALPAPVLRNPSWSGSSLALIWSENSLETGFHLQRRITGASAWTDVSTTIGQNVTTTSISGLSDSASYEFRLRATAPEISSPWSDILTVNLAQLPPAAPVLSMPSALSPFRMALNWTLSGTNTQVIVEHAEPGSESWQVIATLPGGSRSFTHESLLPATTHRYRVKVLKGSLSSPYSMVATASTPAITPPGTPSFLSYFAMSAN
jgi:hypothetical protein